MAHVAFACPPLRGHWEPTLALARTLAERGHRVTLITDAADVPVVEKVTIIDPGLPAAGGLLETVRRRAGVFGTVRGWHAAATRSVSGCRPCSKASA